MKFPTGKEGEEHFKAVEAKIEMVEKLRSRIGAAALQKTMVTFQLGGQSCASAPRRDWHPMIRLDRLLVNTESRIRLLPS